MNNHHLPIRLSTGPLTSFTITTDPPVDLRVKRTLSQARSKPAEEESLDSWAPIHALWQGMEEAEEKGKQCTE